jgi:peroxiredoxin Q/BCP
MAQLRRDFMEYKNRQTEILVIGPEGPQVFQKYWREHDLPFMGLPDPKRTVLKLFGQEVNLFKLGRMPAQVIVDKKGLVRFAYYGRSMSDIPENREVLVLLDRINEISETPA